MHATFSHGQISLLPLLPRGIDAVERVGRTTESIVLPRTIIDIANVVDSIITITLLRRVQTLE